MRINQRITFELFVLALAGACFNGLAAQEAKTPQTPAKSGAGVAPAENHGLEGHATAALPVAENAPPFSPQYIGRVIRLAPEGITQRDGIPGGNLLRLGELVELGENIQTDFYGRAQIQLFNGPALNLGSSSSLKITAYDAPTQQIRVELPAGSMSVESINPAPPGASLEVQTATAVLDGVGSFVVYDPPRFTDICEVSGVAAVRSANPSVSGEVRLNSGECTHVVLNQAPTPPKKAPKVLRSESRFTSVAALPNDDKLFPPRNP